MSSLYHEIAVYGTYEVFYLNEARKSRTKCQRGGMFVSLYGMKQVLVGVHRTRSPCANNRCLALVIIILVKP